MTEEMLKKLAESDTWDIPKYDCPICVDDVDGSFYGIYNHLAGHIAELLIKVNKVLELKE